MHASLSSTANVVRAEPARSCWPAYSRSHLSSSGRPQANPVRSRAGSNGMKRITSPSLPVAWDISSALGSADALLGEQVLQVDRLPESAGCLLVPRSGEAQA